MFTRFSLPAFTLLVTLMAFMPGATAADKVALVIGNAAYSQLNPLNNTVNDARAMAQAFADIGFETQLVIDADEAVLRKAIRRFSTDSDGKALAVVFYAGHGVQVEGDNYILPTDFEPPRAESDVKISGLKIDDVLAAMRAQVRVVFLDACRDSPAIARRMTNASRSTAGQSGLAPIRSADVGDGSGVFIAFATAAGKVAQDGDGAHSPFTQALLDNIKNPTSIDDMFSLVTKQVSSATKNAQRPYKYASLDSIVCLSGTCAGSTPVSHTPSQAGRSAMLSVVDPNDDRWLLVGLSAADGARYYLAQGSIKRTGAFITLEAQRVPADGSDTTLNKVALDCKQRTATVHGGVVIQGGRKIAATEYYSAPETATLAPISRGSIYETLSAFACEGLPTTAETAGDVVFSDAWTPVAIDDQAVKWSVLPTSIKRAGKEVVFLGKQDIPSEAKPTPESALRGINEAFNSLYAVKVVKTAVDCDAAEMRTITTEGWTREKVMSGKYALTPETAPPTKLAAGKVGATVAAYVCAKAGRKLVTP